MSDIKSVHDLAVDYARADDMIRELEATAKLLRKKKAEQEDLLMAAMVDEGAPSVEVEYTNREGVKTRVRVYPTSKLYARRDADVDAETFEAAVEEAGYSDLIKRTVNTNSLSAVVRELAEAAGVRDAGPAVIKEALNPILASVLAINTTPTLAIRRK